MLYLYQEDHAAERFPDLGMREAFQRTREDSIGDRVLIWARPRGRKLTYSRIVDERICLSYLLLQLSINTS
jgi:hypothetical protein